MARRHPAGCSARRPDPGSRAASAADLRRPRFSPLSGGLELGPRRPLLCPSGAPPSTCAGRGGGAPADTRAGHSGRAGLRELSCWRWGSCGGRRPRDARRVARLELPLACAPAAEAGLRRPWQGGAVGPSLLVLQRDRRPLALRSKPAPPAHPHLHRRRPTLSRATAHPSLPRRHPAPVVPRSLPRRPGRIWAGLRGRAREVQPHLHRRRYAPSRGPTGPSLLRRHPTPAVAARRSIAPPWTHLGGRKGARPSVPGGGAIQANARRAGGGSQCQVRFACS
ncbi:hypothetical protein PVAP13_7NG376621 [Panicum virgatum]|uniref:Uncharacterized protein n=1 Tax=Panicum virgatum TaxID=38727 RepID=A0A8T0Q558_PANVG|nr:hypothetical protein PVAP13_7NG376621 [Panicum virgatum]